MIMPGKRVRVTRGVWEGLEGKVMRLNNCSATDARLWYVQLDISERICVWESALEVMACDRTI